MGSSTLFSIVAVPINIPTNIAKGSIFSTSILAFVISSLIDDGCSNRSEVISHCGFNLHLPNDWRRKWLPTPVFWPGEFHGVYSPWGRKEWDTVRDFHLHLTQMTGDVEHLFMYLLAFYIHSLEDCLFRSFAHF